MKAGTSPLTFEIISFSSGICDLALNLCKSVFVLYICKQEFETELFSASVKLIQNKPFKRNAEIFPINFLFFQHHKNQNQNFGYETKEAQHFVMNC